MEDGWGGWWVLNWAFNQNTTEQIYHETEEVIYQAWDTAFHHQMKQWEESGKYDTQRSIFVEPWGVSSGDETLLNAWYYFSNKMIFEGEIKDAKTTSFSSDFQTLINH